MPVIIDRITGRVLVLDPRGRLLLLQGFDPARPQTRFWFTVGGGTEPGESQAQAAARELREETGIRAQAADLGEPVYRRHTEFSFNGKLLRQDEEFFVLRTSQTAVSQDGLEQIERDTFTGHRWWDPAELAASDEPYYPPELPLILSRLNAATPPAADELADELAADELA